MRYLEGAKAVESCRDAAVRRFSGVHPGASARFLPFGLPLCALPGSCAGCGAGGFGKRAEGLDLPAETWFYRILVNESLTYLRRHRREVLPFEEALADLPAQPAPDRAEALDLYAAIDRLDPKLKTVVMLRFFEDMKLAEIAQVTGANLNTVKSRLSTALRRLRLAMEEESL